jgi:hypothetical protein
MGGGYVPPHLRGGRGASASAAARARGRNARDNDGSRPVGAEAVVAAALASRDAAERKLSRDGAVAAASTRDALTEVSRAIRSALEDATKDSQAYWAANPDKRHDAILALAESLSATASATLVAARVGPLVPSLLATEAEGSRAAVALYNESVEAFEGVLAMREQHVSEQKALAAAAKRDRHDFDARSKERVQRLDKDPTPNAVSLETAAVARVSLANALAAIGEIFASNEAHDHALPVLLRAERTYERVADDAAKRAAAAESAYDRTVSENATRSVGHHVATQSAQSALQRRARASAACFDAIWNLGDARGKVAECHAARGMFDDAAASRAASFSAFESAVARADSSAGDDLGGVVYDWGCVLVAHAQTELERARSVATQWRSRDGASVCSPDAAWSTAQREAFETAVASAFGRAASALDAAEEKLARAAEFSPGDVAPLVAKGEALQTRAETQRRRREFAVFVGAGDGNRETGSGVSDGSQSDGTGGSEIEALVAPLRLAADAAGGAFGAALRVDATHFDALVGLAECRVEIGKTFASNFASASPDVTRRALDEFRAGWLLYRRALELAGAGGAGNGAHVSGSDPGSARDRLNVAYAAACAAHLAGESETCGEILANVLRCGGCAPATIAADEDLVGLRPGLWGGG